MQSVTLSASIVEQMQEGVLQHELPSLERNVREICFIGWVSECRYLPGSGTATLMQSTVLIHATASAGTSPVKPIFGQTGICGEGAGKTGVLIARVSTNLATSM
jgi:hypothetical protein